MRVSRVSPIIPIRNARKMCPCGMSFPVQLTRHYQEHIAKCPVFQHKNKGAK